MRKTRVAVRGKGKAANEDVNAPMKAVKWLGHFVQLARVLCFFIAFGALVYGGTTCSARGSMEPDGRSSWEVNTQVSGKAEAHGVASGEPQRRRAPDE